MALTTSRSSTSITMFPVCLKGVRDVQESIKYGTDISLVNEILGDHNVDKQITDNKGDVSCWHSPIMDM